MMRHHFYPPCAETETAISRHHGPPRTSRLKQSTCQGGDLAVSKHPDLGDGSQTPKMRGLDPVEIRRGLQASGRVEYEQVNESNNKCKQTQCHANHTNQNGKKTKCKPTITHEQQMQRPHYTEHTKQIPQHHNIIPKSSNLFFFSAWIPCETNSDDLKRSILFFSM